MTKTATPKKRNATEATLRNVRAAAKRTADLTARVAQLELNQQFLLGELAALKQAWRAR